MASVEILRAPRWQADVLISALEAEGISYEAVHGHTDFFGPASHSVIRVDEKDAEAARALASSETEWRSGDFGDDEYTENPPKLRRKLRNLDQGEWFAVVRKYADRHRSQGVHRLLGFLALFSDDHETARAVLMQLVEKWPEDPTFRWWLGLALYENEQQSEASALFDSLVEDHPDSPHGWVGRALVAARAGGPKTVDDAIMYALSLVDPRQHRVAGERLASLLVWRGFIADAEELYAALAEVWDANTILIPHALLVEQTDPQSAEGILEEARASASRDDAGFDEYVARQRKKIEAGIRRSAE